MAELKDFIVRTRLDNTDENQKTGNQYQEIFMPLKKI